MKNFLLDVNEILGVALTVAIVAHLIINRRRIVSLTKNYLACMKKIPVAVVMKYVDELLEMYGQPAKEIPRVPNAYKCRVIDIAGISL